jgi:molybdate transport system substrate-binding protein
LSWFAKRLFIAAAAAALALTACGGGTSAQPTPAAAPKMSGALTVLAAASLTNSFNRIGQQLMAANPGLTIKFSFAGSPTLVTQVQQGAPADIIATADQANMAKVTTGGFNSGTPVVFAHNKLQIAVQPNNPRKISTVSDLANPAIRFDSCAPAVPCGAYSINTFAKAGVKVTPVSLEPDVTTVLSKVALGEADAGIVYVTDVKGANGQVTGIVIPDDINTIAEYPIVQLRTTQNAAAAQGFIDYVAGSEGQKVLASYGFLPKG